MSDVYRRLSPVPVAQRVLRYRVIGKKGVGLHMDRLKDVFPVGCAKILALSLFVFTGNAAEVRETVSFKGPFDMHRSRGVTFRFDCDNPDAICRSYVYFKSGKGCYIVPFAVDGSGEKVLTANRNNCTRVEKTPEGWRNVDEIIVSFWRSKNNKVRWSATDVLPMDNPYQVVMVVPKRAGYGFPKMLEECGLSVLVATPDELDEEVLAPAKLLVPVFDKKRRYPEKAESLIRGFERNGGKILTVQERLSATSHRKLLQILMKRLPEMNDVFSAKMAIDDERKKKDAEAASRLAVFLKAGGEAEIRGISCHAAYGPENVGNDVRWEDWDRNCRLLKQAGFNTLNVNVSRGGIAFYESSVLPVSPEVKAKGDAVELIKKACDKYGMNFVAWKVCFKSRHGMMTPAFRKWMAEGRAEVSILGVPSEEWLCPVQEANRRLEIESLVELAKRKPWAISLDYIRYHGANWCFCECCKRTFEERTGEKELSWPKDVQKGGRLNGKWEAFRCENITSLVREVVRRVRSEAPGVKVRVDVSRHVGGRALLMAQDWGKWCREGLLDSVSPMNGVPSADELRGYLEAEMRAASGTPLVPTYYPSLAEKRFNADDLMSLVRVGREAGTAGFCAFRFDARLIDMLNLE